LRISILNEHFGQIPYLFQVLKTPRGNPRMICMVREMKHLERNHHKQMFEKLFTRYLHF